VGEISISHANADTECARRLVGAICVLDKDIPMVHLGISILWALTGLLFHPGRKPA